RLSITPASDKMKIDTPTDGVPRIGRFISSHGEITLLHSFLKRLAEVDEVSDLDLVDFLDYSPHLDPREFGPGPTDHFKYHDPFRPLHLEFLLNLLIDLPNNDSEFLSEACGFRICHGSIVGSGEECRSGRSHASNDDEEEIANCSEQ